MTKEQVILLVFSTFKLLITQMAVKDVDRDSKESVN